MYSVSPLRDVFGLVGVLPEVEEDSEQTRIRGTKPNPPGIENPTAPPLFTIDVKGDPISEQVLGKEIRLFLAMLRK